MDDAEVPCENRTLFVSAATYKLIRLSDEYLKIPLQMAKQIFFT